MNTSDFIRENKSSVNAGLVFAIILIIVWGLNFFAEDLGLIIPKVDGTPFGILAALIVAFSHSLAFPVLIIVGTLLYHKYQSTTPTGDQMKKLGNNSIMLLFGTLSLFMLGYGYWIVMESPFFFDWTTTVCRLGYIAIVAIFAIVVLTYLGIKFYEKALVPAGKWVIETPLRMTVVGLLILFIVLGALYAPSIEQRKQARIERVRQEEMRRQKQAAEEAARQVQQTPPAQTQIGVPYTPITPNLPSTINVGQNPVNTPGNGSLTSQYGPAPGIVGVH